MTDDLNKTGRGGDQFVVRFPAGMRDELKARAAQNRRSMNSEVVARLERTLKEDGDATQKR